MPDSAQVYYLIDGKPIDNISNFQMSANGGGSTFRRGITRSKKPLGRRRTQLPDYSGSFTRDVIVGEQDFDFHEMRRNNTKFVMTEVADILTTNWPDCEVDSIEPSVDEDGNKTETVNFSAPEQDGPF